MRRIKLRKKMRIWCGPVRIMKYYYGTEYGKPIRIREASHSDFIKLSEYITPEEGSCLNSSKGNTKLLYKSNAWQLLKGLEEIVTRPDDGGLAPCRKIRRYTSLGYIWEKSDRKMMMRKHVEKVHKNVFQTRRELVKRNFAKLRDHRKCTVKMKDSEHPLLAFEKVGYLFHMLFLYIYNYLQVPFIFCYILLIYVSSAWIMLQRICILMICVPVVKFAENGKMSLTSFW